MATVKTLWTFVLAGAILGAISATIIAPGFLTWYNTPGGMGQALCNCPELVHATTTQLIKAQLYGSAIGAIAFMVLGIIYVRARGRRAAKKAQVAQSQTPPSANVPTPPME
jgi:hypothetical protein